MPNVEIHPTALVSPGAVIGNGSTIGPYSVIGEEVEIGSDCNIHNHVVITGKCRIGKKNTFHSHSVIGGLSQDLKYSSEPTFLEIGDSNNFREFVTINRGTEPDSKTIVGSYGNFLAYSHIAHDCIVGDHVIFSNNGTLAGHVQMGDYAILGGLTAVHQFCRIGKHAITGGCSKIVQDVPPFMVADGNPAEIRSINSIGLQRRGFSQEQIKSLKDAYKIIFLRNLTISDAVTQLKEMAAQYSESSPIKELIDFVVSSERGIIRR
ncbi:MAG: acyl-[acyl-carrier-protein]--UDP-N-acetylglucosamine O-acyltransferase [Verrucomicrobiales bacterium]|nr:acyl-[acyl-carrier-protein]--UDP-N-acetylglucosamine O-acyltransferase [Verrucomicrobiales bacterium]